MVKSELEVKMQVEETNFTANLSLNFVQNVNRARLRGRDHRCPENLLARDATEISHKRLHIQILGEEHPIYLEDMPTALGKDSTHKH